MGFWKRNYEFSIKINPTYWQNVPIDKFWHNI